MIVDLLASPAVAGFSVSKTRGQGPGAGEHSTHRSAAGLGDQADNQPDEGLEGGSGKARAELGQETGQRARCGGAGRHRRITLTSTVHERSMLSSSRAKIHNHTS